MTGAFLYHTNGGGVAPSAGSGGVFEFLDIVTGNLHSDIQFRLQATRTIGAQELEDIIKALQLYAKSAN